MKAASYIALFVKEWSKDINLAAVQHLAFSLRSRCNETPDITNTFI